MLHPSYTDLMKVVNSEVGEGDTPVVNSRYSIVMATAKRARQIIAGDVNVTPHQASKPLSTAVKELNEGKIKIMPELPEGEDELIQELTVEEGVDLEVTSAEEAEGHNSVEDSAAEAASEEDTAEAMEEETSDAENVDAAEEASDLEKFSDTDEPSGAEEV